MYSLCLTPSGLPIVATFPSLAISRSAAVARSMSSVSLLLAPLRSLWSNFVGVRSAWFSSKVSDKDEAEHYMQEDLRLKRKEGWERSCERKRWEGKEHKRAKASARASK